MTLREAAELLRRAGVENPCADAGILLSELCGIPKERLPFSADEEFDNPEFRDAVKRRAKREPLQYILGRWWFWGNEFYVSPDCLIPRPETEMLVELAVKRIPAGGKLLDLCTGSGCVALSVLRDREDVSALAADISAAALSVAGKNSEKLRVSDRVQFVLADVTSDVPGELGDGLYDVILANPPYISATEMTELEPELRFEPEIALTDGGDGMSVVRGILVHYTSLLRDGGVIAIEIGSRAGEAALAEGLRTGLSCKILRDYAGLDRVLVCEK